MSSKRAVSVSRKTGLIYLGLSLLFILIFGGISAFLFFLSKLNF